MYFTIIFFVFLRIASGNSSFDSIEQPATKNEQVTETIEINFSNKSIVSEMQHTICSIKTEEVVAKAQSTASRILTGICTSEEMTKAFQNLEKIMLEKLEQIQQNLLTSIQSKFQTTVPKKSDKNSKISAFKTIDYLFDKNIFQNFT